MKPSKPVRSYKQSVDANNDKVCSHNHTEQWDEEIEFERLKIERWEDEGGARLRKTYMSNARCIIK